MNTRFTMLAKSLVLAIATIALFTLSQGSAKADIVTFGTTGCFGAGCTPTIAATTTGSGTASLAFAGQPPGTTVNTSTPSGFTTADLGTFVVAGAGTFSSTPFTLQVNQTVPSVGNGIFSGTLSGTLITGGSDARIVFSNTFLQIGTVRYQLVNLTNGNTLFFDPNATGGITRISAQISAVPEPATMVLLGTGLAGIAAKLRKRRKTAE